MYIDGRGRSILEVGDYVEGYGTVLDLGHGYINWSEAGMMYPEVDDDEDDDSDIPEGCQACGGPYPDCKTSCVLFDD